MESKESIQSINLSVQKRMLRMKPHKRKKFETNTNLSGATIFVGSYIVSNLSADQLLNTNRIFERSRQFSNINNHFEHFACYEFFALFVSVCFDMHNRTHWIEFEIRFKNDSITIETNE